MAKGKYAVRAANKRALANHESAEQIQKDLDAAIKEVERLQQVLAATRRDMDSTVERLVREALREERARMKAAMRDNEQRMRQELFEAEQSRSLRDSAMVGKLEVALRALLGRAAEIANGEGIIDTEHALVLNEVFEELGEKYPAAKFRSILGVKSEGQVAYLGEGIGRVEISARFLNRRSAKRVARDAAENMRSAR